jgi:hypothetical protein
MAICTDDPKEEVYLLVGRIVKYLIRKAVTIAPKLTSLPYTQLFFTKKIPIKIISSIVFQKNE